MTERHFDVVIIGARCAGAALATCLARAGAHVLMVDHSPMPSDQVLSTHNIHPPGMDILDDIGVGDAVRAEAPATRVLRIRKNEAWMDVPFGEGRAGSVRAASVSTACCRTPRSGQVPNCVTGRARPASFLSRAVRRV